LHARAFNLSYIGIIPSQLAPEGLEPVRLLFDSPKDSERDNRHNRPSCRLGRSECRVRSVTPAPARRWWRRTRP